MKAYNISIYIDKETHEKLKRKAMQEDLSLSNYVRRVLKRHLQETEANHHVCANDS